MKTSSKLKHRIFEDFFDIDFSFTVQDTKLFLYSKTEVYRVWDLCYDDKYNLNELTKDRVTSKIVYFDNYSLAYDKGNGDPEAGILFIKSNLKSYFNYFKNVATVQLRLHMESIRSLLSESHDPTPQVYRSIREMLCILMILKKFNDEQPSKNR